MRVGHLQDAMELQPGQIFEGRYQIIQEIGRGGFGVVFKALQPSMDRHVALKVLSVSSGQEAERTARERFLREVRIISKLRHPNTVTIHDFGETSQGMVYMVLEFVGGLTLKNALKQAGVFDEQRAIHVGIQIAKSLSEAHRHKIIHRDLKPANIMLTQMGSDEDVVKVLDFGIARLRDDLTTDLTNVGLGPDERELIGTPRYMSPEQVRGSEVTPASDIYSLGLMLYQMLSGQPAVQGETTIALIAQQASPTPLALVHLNQVNPRLATIIRVATDKDPRQRYQRIDLLVQDLEQALIDVRQSMYQSGAYNPTYSNEFARHVTGGYQALNPGHQTPNGQRVSGSYPVAHAPSGPHQPLSASGAYTSAPKMLTEATVPHMEAGFQGGMGSYGMIEPGAPAYSGINTAPEPANPGSWTNVLNSSTLPESFNGRGQNLSHQQVPLARQDPLGGQDLPPRPPEVSAFAPDPSLQDQEPKEVVNESVSGWVIHFTLVLVFAILLVIVDYLVFLVLGAVLGRIMGGGLRFGIALAGGVLIPAIALITEGGFKDDRLRAYRWVIRIRRSLSVGLAMGVVSLILLVAILPKDVMHQLRIAPNWFFNVVGVQNAELAEKNQKLSHELADLVEGAGISAGIIKKSQTDTSQPTPTPKAPAVTPSKKTTPKAAVFSDKPIRLTPAPTRPGNKTSTTKKTTAPTPKKGVSPPKKKTSSQTTPSPTEKKGKNEKYIDW